MQRAILIQTISIRFRRSRGGRVAVDAAAAAPAGVPSARRGGRGAPAALGSTGGACSSRFRRQGRSSPLVLSATGTGLTVAVGVAAPFTAAVRVRDAAAAFAKAVAHPAAVAFVLPAGATPTRRQPPPSRASCSRAIAGRR